MKNYFLKIVVFIFFCISAERSLSQSTCDVSGSETGSAAWNCNVNYQARFNASYSEYAAQNAACEQSLVECVTESTSELMSDLSDIDNSYTIGDITYEQWENLFDETMDFFDSSMNDCYGGGIDQTSGYDGCMNLSTGYYVDDLIADAEFRNDCYCANVPGCTEYCD